MSDEASKDLGVETEEQRKKRKELQGTYSNYSDIAVADMSVKTAGGEAVNRRAKSDKYR